MLSHGGRMLPLMKRELLLSTTAAGRGSQCHRVVCPPPPGPWFLGSMVPGATGTRGWVGAAGTRKGPVAGWGATGTSCCRNQGPCGGATGTRGPRNKEPGALVPVAPGSWRPWFLWALVPGAPGSWRPWFLVPVAPVSLGPVSLRPLAPVAPYPAPGSCSTWFLRSQVPAAPHPAPGAPGLGGAGQTPGGGADVSDGPRARRRIRTAVTCHSLSSSRGSGASGAEASGDRSRCHRTPRGARGALRAEVPLPEEHVSPQ
ncbi:unnamed protein product [Gadus morhua 'NCC']